MMESKTLIRLSYNIVEIIQHETVGPETFFLVKIILRLNITLYSILCGFTLYYNVT